MPAPVEYHHLVQLALDGEGARAQILDMDGRCRERFSWPPESGKVRAWRFRVAELGARPAQLLLAGREAVGMSVGIPKRQEGKPQAPKDDLDDLLDELEQMD